MITVEQAISRLEKKYPNQRIVAGLDMGDFYAFSMMSRSVNPSSVVGVPVEPTMKAIRKENGDEFAFHIFHSSEGEVKGEIDVARYLSSADADFARRMKSLLEG